MVARVTNFTCSNGVSKPGRAERKGNRGGLEGSIGSGIEQDLEGGSGENFNGFWRGEKIASISERIKMLCLNNTR